MTEYDSTKDTQDHIYKVGHFLGMLAKEMYHRSLFHDASKLKSPEKEAFDRETPLLKDLTFGSPEYNESLLRLKEALTHHYANNSHHPEHYENGVAGMCVVDLIEMLCDWKAASLRQKDQTPKLEAAFERFKIEPQLQAIIRNTFNIYFEYKDTQT